ncbi:MAG: 6-bladed beta-propeller [Fodinibius sp.]|nr:6-bladed beta-propeller [Fodinibius sp.]
MDTYPYFILFCIILGIFSCSETNKSQNANEFTGNKLPSHIKNVENLSVYPIDKPAPKKIKLVKEQVYESNKEVIINGYIGPVAVDNSGRVYIVGQKPGAVGIYVFSSRGNYLTTISQHGRGPGEYEAIKAIKIRNNKLWIFDPRLQKIGSFSLKDYTHIKDEVIIRKEERNYKNIIYRLRGNDLFVTEKGNLLLKLSSNLSLNKPNDSPVILLHKLSNSGAIIPGSILKLDRFQFYYPKKKGEQKLTVPNAIHKKLNNKCNQRRRILYCLDR